QGDCQIANQRGMRHVAEVRDASDPPVIVNENVAECHVVVDDLRSERVEYRRHVEVEPVEDLGGHRACAVAADVLDKRTQPCCELEIPEDLAAGTSVKHASQCES